MLSDHPVFPILLSTDLDALAIYTNSFPVRLSPHAAGPGKLTPEAERGMKLFFSSETKCATCQTDRSLGQLTGNFAGTNIQGHKAMNYKP